MSVPAERTILVVDDSADDRDLIRHLLRKQRSEYIVIAEATGEAGLERVRRERPDCLLLDYYLPDMDGREFLDALRAAGGGWAQPVPIVLLTGQDRDEIAAEVLTRGAQDYLVKDALTGQALVRAVENAIEKFHIHHELQEQRAAAELRNHKLEVLREELQAGLAELADAQQARDRFLAIMSHEMRTPLNAILGYTELLELELEGELTDGQRAQLERIRLGGRHLLDLINDVLDLARADARKLEMDIRPVDLRAVLEEVVALLESQAATKGIRLEVEDRERVLPHVQADLQRLRQILTNLIGNAIKFTERGSVVVRCEASAGGEVRVRISDTGIGMEPEIIPLIFDEFYQAKDELTREKGGSGLGLAISRRLARLMGGDVEASSVPGEGSVFTVILRQAEGGSELREDDVERHAARMKDHHAPPARPSRTGVPVVAFADSEPLLAELQRQVHPGVRLVWTNDPDEVSALAVREGAVLVVLDISSERGAAWRAAQALQARPELAHAAILLLPSMPAAVGDGPSEGIDLGWVSVIPKPFSPEQLTSAIAAAAGGFDEGEGRPGCDVLVVDDDPDSRRVAAKILAEVNARVQEAGDGETALMKMRAHPPDVVVLDLMMPVLDGFGVLATMRADAILAGVPVVVLTAKSLTQAEREFLSRTAARVLQKGEHRLADVASLVLRAAARAPRSLIRPPSEEEGNG